MATARRGPEEKREEKAEEGVTRRRALARDERRASASRSSSEGGGDSSVIPESEVLRLAEQTGILKKVEKPDSQNAARRAGGKSQVGRHRRRQAEDEERPLLQALFLSVPVISLHLVFDTLVHAQYQQDTELWASAQRILQAYPVYLFLVYLTNLHKHRVFMKLALTLACTSAGSFLVHVTRNGPAWQNLRSSAPLGCIWVYTVVQLDLKPALAGLAGVAAFYVYESHFATAAGPK